MAVTFAVTDFRRGNTGDTRQNTGLLTMTGTTSDDGDALSAAAVGLSVIDSLELETFLDSTSNPENAFIGTYNKTSGKIVLHTAHGTPGGAVPLLQVTDGTTVTGYSARFCAVGR
jgi:hypothetical protein